MDELNNKGRKLLAVLVKHLKKVKVGKPETYITYSEALTAIGKNIHKVDNPGVMLKSEGLSALAEWTKDKNLPAITGIIVAKSNFEPGTGYFNLFNQIDNPFEWWKEEVQKSIDFDWAPYLELKQSLAYEKEPNAVGADTKVDDRSTNADEVASDVGEPPKMETVQITWIIRDTKISRKVKEIHGHRCQICGIALKFSNEKFYAEAHHIIPLGSGHQGPDTIENLLCLCPNHHAELDFGARSLSSEALIKNKDHSVSQKSIDYHNSEIFGKIYR